jgi:hypothetical protein
MSIDTDDTTRTMKAYDEVCRAYERIDDFRAKLLGVLPVVSGAGLFLLLGNTGVGAAVGSNWKFLTFAGTFGTIATVGLLFYEQRGIQYCTRLTTVAQELESKLGVRGRFTSWPHSLRRFVNEPTASGLIYSSMVAAWVFVAVSRVPVAALVAAAISGLACFLATRAFYWWVTWDEEIARGERPTLNTWSYRRFARRINRRIVEPWPTTPGKDQAKWLGDRLGDHELSSVTRDFLAERLGEEKLRIARQTISDVSEDRRPTTRRNLEEIAAVAERRQGRLDE